MTRHKRPGARPWNIHTLPRRFLFLFTFVVICILLLILANPLHRIPTSSSELRKSAQHGGRHAKDFIQNPNIPALYNPFADSAHKPPDQTGSKSGDTRWYNDWKWLQPFSSQVTLDDDRALLPPLADRTRIYTYYDATEKTRDVKDAEHQLLLAWRRAWWAKGFEPVILARAEAQKNEILWDQLQKLKLDLALKQELERWLAWHYIGGGILVEWLLFPMARHDDTTLGHLRRSEFKNIARVKDFGTGLFAGKASDIRSALSEAFEAKDIADTKDIFTAMRGGTFSTVDEHEGVAYYDASTLTSRYPEVAKELKASLAPGLGSLLKLINAHLSQTWQNHVSKGIAILKPYAGRTTALTTFAVHIGQILSLCQDSPLPRSCPPNIPSCKPCDPDRSLPVSLPLTYTNTTGLFTLGTVPHPLTLTALLHSTDALTTPFVRRQTARDQWLDRTTGDLLGSKISGPQRLVGFKEAVAGHAGVAGATTDLGSGEAWTGLWFTAEREDPVELEWVFGFSLPKSRKMEDPVAFQLRLEQEQRSKHNQLDPDSDTAPSSAQLAREKALMGKMRAVLVGRGRGATSPREVVEAWNLADTEAWRFVRALGMRRHEERVAWEEVEGKFVGAMSRRGVFDHG